MSTTDCDSKTRYKPIPYERLKHMCQITTAEAEGTGAASAIDPAHYKDTYPFEVIELLEKMLTPEQFIGFCLGNEIKYRMRAGIKDPSKLVEDIKKAEWYNNRRVQFEFNQY